MKKISVIIPVWNAINYTETCINLLLKYKSSIHELIVIDNGSTDQTSNYLQKIFKKNKDWFKIHTFKANEGFVTAVNKGIEIREPGTDILILNNDVEIHDGKLFKQLQEKAYSLDKCAAVIPKQMSPSGDFLCGPSFTLPVSKVGFSYGNQVDINQFSHDFEAEVIMFACTYIRSDALEAVGPLDINIKSYAEDSDWCLRAREKGFKIWYAGEYRVIHHHNITSQVNKIDLNDLRRQSVEYFAYKHRDHFKNRYKGEVTIQGSTGFPTGYSKLTEHIMRGLEEDPDPVKVHYGSLYGVSEFEPPSESKYINEIRMREGNRGGTQIVIGQGDVFYKNSGERAIGLTMMDCDYFPEEWTRQANMMNELWVPTEYGKQVMIESGVKTPIHVIPLGVDPNYYNPDILPITKFNAIRFRRSVNFLSVFEWGERKMPELMIHAFYKAFSDNPDVALFIKHQNSNPEINVREIVAKIAVQYPRSKCTIVFLSNSDYNGYNILEYMMPSLYRAHDAFILPSAGEGFGLPSVEALACGLPVGITGKFGYLPEFKDDFPGTVYFDYDMETITPEMVQCFYYHGSKWARPKLDDMIDKFRFMFENIEDLKAKALISSEKVRSSLTWKHTVSKIKERILHA